MSNETTESVPTIQEFGASLVGMDSREAADKTHAAGYIFKISVLDGRRPGRGDCAQIPTRIRVGVTGGKVTDFFGVG